MRLHARQDTRQVRSRFVCAATTGVLVIALATPATTALAATTTPQVGAACTKAGTASGKLTCTTKAGKLVWAAGAAAAGSAAAGIDGTWKATTGSVVGYRVNEVINGQKAAAVGRTSVVTGSMTITGTKATAVALSVDMTSVASDQNRRDGQFHGRIMETAKFPTATLKLAAPIDFAKVPADRAEVSAKGTVSLTLHGATKSVAVSVAARRNGANIEVNGTIPIVFADYAIKDPSFGGFVKTEDHGVLEFLVVFGR